MAIGRVLDLGVLFKGKRDASFMNAIRSLRSALTELNKAFKNVGNAAEEAKKKIKGMSLGTELSGYQRMMGNASDETQMFQNALAGVASQTARTDSALKASKNTVASVEKAVQKLGLQMTAQGANGQAFTEKFNRMAVVNDILSNKLKQTSKGFAQMDTGISASSRALLRYQKEFGGVTESVKKAGSEFVKTAGYADGVRQKFSYALTSMMAWAPAATIVYGGLNLVRQGFQEIVSFDQALANLSAISMDTVAAVSAMGDKILEVGGKYRYSSNEIADAMTLIAQAGYSASEAIDTIEAVAQLSTGTLEDMRTTADLVTTALRAFHLESFEASRVADIMAAAINYSKLGVQELRVAFNYLGPAAYASKISLEEATAAAALLANAGMRASTIGTGLRQVFARLVAPSEKLRDAFAHAGIEISKLNPITNSFADIVGELNKVIPTSERAFQLFGMRAANAAIVLAKAGREGFNDMLLKMQDVGTASEMAERQMKGLGSQIENFISLAKNLAIALGESGVGGALKLIITVLGEFLKLLTGVVNSGIGSFLVSTAMLTVVLGGLYKGLKIIGSALLAIPFGTSAAAVRVAAAAMGTATIASDALSTSFARLGTFIKAHPFLIVAGAIALIVKGFIEWNAVQERTTLEAKKQVIVHEKNVKVLQTYTDRLGQVNQGSLEHDNIIKRLRADYPQFNQILDETNGNIDEQRQALADLVEVEKQLTLDNLRVALEGTSRQLKDLEEKIDNTKQAIRSAAGDMGFFEHMLWILEDPMEFLQMTWGMLMSELGQGPHIMEVLNSKLNKLTGTQARTKREAGELAAQYELLTGTRWDFGNLAIPVVTIASMKALRETIEQLEKSWEEMTDTERNEAQKNLIASMGQDWIDLYQTLESLGKADLARQAAVTNAKIAQMEKYAQEAKWNEKQIADKREEIEKEGLKTFVENELKKYKEALSALNNYLSEYQKQIDNHVKMIGDSYDLERDKISESYEERRRLLELNLSKELTLLETQNLREGELQFRKKELYRKYYEDIVRLSRQNVKDLLDLADRENQDKKNMLDQRYRDIEYALQKEEGKNKDVALKIQEIERQKAEAIRQINRETLEEKNKILNAEYEAVKGHLSKLMSEYQNAAQNIRSLDEAAKQSEMDRLEGERQIRQSAMTDMQKYADDIKEHARLISEARRAAAAKDYEAAKDYYKDAAQLAQGLTGEVKDEEGNILKTKEETAKKALQLYRDDMKSHKDMIEQEKRAEQERMQELSIKIKDLEKLLKDIQKAIQDINAEQMKINTEAAQNSLDALSKTLDEIIKKMNELDGKTIDTYINNHVNTITSSSSSSSSDSSGSESYSQSESSSAAKQIAQGIANSMSKYKTSISQSYSNFQSNAKNALASLIPSPPTPQFQTAGTSVPVETVELILRTDDKELPTTVTSPNARQLVNEFIAGAKKRKLTHG